MFMPEVIQVKPMDNYIVEILFQDGKIVNYDVKPLLEKEVFKVLKDKNFYTTRCTVMNHTLAWDVSGNYDTASCIDIDPNVLYQALSGSGDEKNMD